MLNTFCTNSDRTSRMIYLRKNSNTVQHYHCQCTHGNPQEIDNWFLALNRLCIPLDIIWNLLLILTSKAFRLFDSKQSENRGYSHRVFFCSLCGHAKHSQNGQFSDVFTWYLTNLKYRWGQNKSWVFFLWFWCDRPNTVIKGIFCHSPDKKMFSLYLIIISVYFFGYQCKRWVFTQEYI